MGGAQPLAATMAGASMLAVECQPSRIEMRLRDRLPGRKVTDDLDQALADHRGPPAPKGEAVSVGCWATAAEIFP